MSTFWHEELTRGGRLLQAGTNGPDVVLVHGLEDRPETWTLVAEGLARTCRVTAFEMPWRVGSQYTWLQEGSPQAWLSSRLEQTGLGHAHLVGHSFGGHAVLGHLAAGGSNPSALLVAPLYRTQVELALPDSTERIRQALRNTVIEGLHLRLGPRLHTIDPDDLAQMGKSLSRDVIERALSALVTCLVRLPINPVLIRRPTRVLVRDGDPSLSSSAATELSRALNTTVLQLAGDGHFLHLIHPSEVTAHILELIEQTHLTTHGGKIPCPSIC